MGTGCLGVDNWPVDFDQPKQAQGWVEADREVQEVQRQQAEAVYVERGGVHVVMAQLGGVGLEDAVFEVACPEVEQDVGRVQEVREVVQTEPH